MLITTIYILGAVLGTLHILTHLIVIKTLRAK